MKKSLYDLRPRKIPRATGTVLNGAATLVENSLTGQVLSHKMLKQLGVLDMRDLATDEVDSPRPPLLPHSRTLSPKPGIPSRILATLAHVPPKTGFGAESIADFTRAYESGQTTPSQIATRILAAIRGSEGLSKPMRIFISQNAQDLLQQAHRSTQRWARGKPLSVLDGVPVAVKDELDQKGYPTTQGTRFLNRQIAEHDATVVSRLRQAGALLIGKTNMHEIGLGVTGINPHYGPARNPHDPSRIAGGSSSGSASAVASGLCPVALGADGGGSIRIPAALCGLVGLKPTFGRISEHGAAPLCWSVAHIGPIGAHVRDVALVYGLIAGTDSADPSTYFQPEPTLQGFADTDLSGLKLGVYPEWFEDADEEIVGACKDMLQSLQTAGASVELIKLPELGLLRTVHMVTIVSEMAASHQTNLTRFRKEYGLDTRLNLGLAARLRATDYLHAQRHRVRLCRYFQEVLSQVDVIVSPTTACVASPIKSDALQSGESHVALLDELMRFAPGANLSGLPAITVPVGYNSQQLPIGMQIMSQAWKENLLLQLAYLIESLVSKTKPQIHFRLLAGKESGTGV